MERYYYDEYYRLERGNWWFLARNQIIINHLKQITAGKSNLDILNIGAATGHTSELLVQFGKVISVEYDSICCEFLRQKLKLETVNASVTRLPFENEHFDLVCAFDVIEHVDNDNLAVSEIKRVCKKDGIVCLTVPAFQFLWSGHDVVNHHFRRYTKRQVIGLLSGDGKFIFHSYFNFWLFFPVSAIRMAMNSFKKLWPGKKPPVPDNRISSVNKILNKLLFSVFYSEWFLISKFIKLPFGVSILISWRK